MNLDGPVRVADKVHAGTATIVVSFDAWKGGTVASTTHVVPVLPVKDGPKEEPTASNLLASLVHPERKASVWGATFSADGTRLLAYGYPSGVVQVWDARSRKELVRIDTPPGYRGSASYAVVTPDWKTLYVPTQKRSVKSFERDGKKLHRVEFSGEVRVWDIATGKEKEPLPAEPGSAPQHALLSPDGRYLVRVERPGYDSANPQPRDVTVAMDLATGRKWKLCDGFGVPAFHPDGKTVAVSPHVGGQTSSVQLLDLATGGRLATRSSPEKEGFFMVGPIAPDGSVVSAYLGGKKGAPTEVWFLDARTLEERGRLIGKAAQERYGWGVSGMFTPDGRRFASVDGSGDILIWDVASSKLERALPSWGGHPTWRLAMSPDGKTLAVGWWPKFDEKRLSAREPDPRDLPQPRVSLVDLEGTAPTRILIAPHGYVGGLAFSPDGKLLAFGGAGAVHLFELSK